MNGHCNYRTPIYNDPNRKVFPIRCDDTPDEWICVCPSGEHPLGANCVDDAAKCKIATRYEKSWLPSFRYKRSSAKALKAQEQAVAEVAEGLPEELAAIVREKYQGKRKAI